VQATPQVHLFAKTLHQHHAAEVRQVRLVERKAQCLQAFGHRKARRNCFETSVPYPSLEGGKESMTRKLPFDQYP
jgi:hypothetical protein